MIKLYHYSNCDLKIISPDYFGINSYSAREKRTAIMPRSFFYLSPIIKEYHLQGSKYLYIAEIKKELIYNMREDNKGLKHKFLSIEDLLNYIKLNYTGMIYDVGFEIATLFYSIKPIEKIILK